MAASSQPDVVAARKHELAALNAYSPWNLAIFALGIFWFTLKSVVEESFLSSDPGYAEYMQRVRWRWLPGIARLGLRVENQQERRRGEWRVNRTSKTAKIVNALLDRFLHHGRVLSCGPRSWRTRTDSLYKSR